MQGEEHPWGDDLRCLPIMVDYEAHRLTSRLEQEIYRCKLWAPAVRDELHTLPLVLTAEETAQFLGIGRHPVYALLCFG